LVASLLALAAPGLDGAAAQADTSTAVAADSAVAGSAVADGAVADSAGADSAVAADSVRLIGELLVANGATAERAAPVAAAIMKYARLNQLDPLLVVGIIGVENASLAPRARSRVGATGVMQVMPSWKRDIRDCGNDLREPHVNVCFGTRILRIALDASASVRQALLRYNGCVRSTTCRTYPTAVFSRAGHAVLRRRALSQVGAARVRSAPPEVAVAGGGI
jgi:soluble lytic murein transglycosylase-like protein